MTALTSQPKCWEHKNCGHAHAGGCPAYPNHGGTCYMLPGTRCRGAVQGKYAEKIGECRHCDFYKLIFKRAA